MIKGRPLGRIILITLEREKESGLILSADTVKGGSSAYEGSLLDEQTVLAVGKDCHEVKVGDKVVIDFSKYRRKAKTSQFEQTNEVYLDIPTMEFDGVEYARIPEYDVVWVLPNDEPLA